MLGVGALDAPARAATAGAQARSALVCDAMLSMLRPPLPTHPPEGLGMGVSRQGCPCALACGAPPRPTSWASPAR